MKTRVLIIEDNFYKSFTTKQVLRAQLKVDIEVVDTATETEFLNLTFQMKPDFILCRPQGGIAGLLKTLEKRGVNRRNTELVIVNAEDLDSYFYKKIEQAVANSGKSKKLQSDVAKAA